MSVAADVSCAVCREPLDGIPYGPRDAECCVRCWFQAGDYGTVRLHAHGPVLRELVQWEDAVGCVVFGHVIALDRDRRECLVRLPDRNGHEQEPEDVPWDWLR